MKKLQINIFTFDLVWMGTIDSVYSLIHRSSWHEITNSEMKISKSVQGIEELKIGRVLIVNNQVDKGLIIEDMTTSLNDSYITFTLIPLKGILNYRICHPSDLATLTARKQSEAMMIIPFNNLVQQTRDPDRKFMNPSGTVNLFGVTDLKTYGETIDFTVDWKTGYMGDVVVSISKMNKPGNYPIGWNIFINQQWTQFVMDTYQATNKTVNQSLNPPVVFSEEFGNIKNANYNYSIKEWRNVAYMIWNNGTEQNIAVGNATHGATKGFNRKEVLLSSSKKNQSEVVNEGYSELNKRPRVESFTAEIINNENTMSNYGVDWFLGDVVTVQSKELIKNQTLSIDVQITEVEEIYDNGEYSINATFGEGKLTFVQLIKNSIKQG